MWLAVFFYKLYLTSVKTLGDSVKAMREQAYILNRLIISLHYNTFIHLT